MNATEQMVLARMNAGTFKVCTKTRTVSYYHLRRRRWYAKRIQRHNRSGRFNDSPDNLQEMSWDDSNRQGGLASQAARYQTYAEDIPY